MGVSGINGTATTTIVANTPYLLAAHSGSGLSVTFWAVNLVTGVLATEVVSNSNSCSAPANGSTLTIGNWAGSSNDMSGAVALMEIYRRKLSTAEIAYRAANPLGIYTSGTPMVGRRYFVPAAVGGTTRGNPFNAGNAFNGGRTFAGVVR
jgi:hypothetical protein